MSRPGARPRDAALLFNGAALSGIFLHTCRLACRLEKVTGVGSTASTRQVAQIKKSSGAGPERADGRQLVAAVCYRMGGRGLEFLLVQTRGGRWIFPKGGVEPGLTQAQSAALEAFEEAGVHGRIEEMPFARYQHGKSGGKSSSKSSGRSSKDSPNVAEITEGRARGESVSVTAHLCQVSHLKPPQEAYRHPTWFSPKRPSAGCSKTARRNSGVSWRAWWIARLQEYGGLRPRAAVNPAKTNYRKCASKRSRICGCRAGK